MDRLTDRQFEKKERGVRARQRDKKRQIVWHNERNKEIIK